MLSSLQLKQIVAEARPLIERQLEIALQIAGLRTVVTEAGGDWSQLKALIKAQVQDEQADDPKRVERILEKADYAKIYADMLGLGRSNMNEQNFSAEDAEDPTGGHMLDQGEGASAPALSPMNPVAKAPAGNAVNATTQGSERAEPQDWNGGDGAGEASRASEGAGSLAPISQADPDKPAEVETSAAPVAPGKRRWTFADKAHADCLNPEQCGGFSNLGLCTNCKTAAGVAA